ncbi:hypothetical protein [Bdellovibrio sp.]|uniref:hypothetical protein n=1 Tax=Bdellovibrio sp. TaxID=28201 RepID=UPI0039E54F76
MSHLIAVSCPAFILLREFKVFGFSVPREADDSDFSETLLTLIGPFMSRWKGGV